MRLIYRLIKLNHLIRSDRLKLFMVLMADVFGARYTSVRMDPILTCNLRCRMCYFSNPEVAQEQKGTFLIEDCRRIADMFFPKALQLVIGCGAEPLMYIPVLQLFDLAKNHHIPNIGITTNGQLLTEKMLLHLYSGGLNELTISLHGVTKETYERFMVRASYQKLHEVLTTITNLKKRYPNTQLRINYTMNPENISELSNFFNVFGKYSIDTLQLRPMVSLGTTDFPAQNLDACNEEYCKVLFTIKPQMKNMVLLAPDSLRTDYKERMDPGLAILPYVHRYISSQRVWKETFDWKNETLRAFCSRTHWKQTLLKGIISGIKKEDAQGSSGKYEITM